MWITRKAIFQEIRKNHDILADRLERHISARENEAASVREQLKSLERRIELLESTCQKEVDAHRQSCKEIKDSLWNIAECLRNLQELLPAKIDASIRALEESTIAISKQETKTVAEDLRSAADRLSEHMERIGEEKAKELAANILQTGEATAGRSEAAVTSVHRELLGSLANLEALVRISGEELARNKQEIRTAIFTEVNSAKTEIVEITNAVENRDGAVAASFKTMEATLQQILRSLSSLDEGNRLLIAKTLLAGLGN